MRRRDPRLNRPLPRASACPGCGAVHDRVTGLGVASDPKAGSFGACFDCGELLIFDADGSFRAPTPGELFGLMLSASWPRIEALQDEIRRRPDRRCRGR